MRKHWLVLVATFVILVCSAAHAQQRQLLPNENKWEFSVFFGSSHRGDGTFVTPLTGVTGTTSTDVGLQFATGYTVGGRITENLGRYFGAELEYSLSNQPVVFLFPNMTQPDRQRLSLDHRVHQITYTVLVYGLPRDSKWRPYGAVGPGLALYEFFGDLEDRAVSQGANVKDRWKVGVSWGGGVKYRFLKNVGIRWDVRNFTTGMPNFGLPGTASPTVAGFRPDGRLQNWQFTVGLSYVFHDH